MGKKLKEKLQELAKREITEDDELFDAEQFISKRAAYEQGCNDGETMLAREIIGIHTHEISE